MGLGELYSVLKKVEWNKKEVKQKIEKGMAGMLDKGGCALKGRGRGWL